MRTTGGEILVRVTDRRDLGREFARIPIVTAADGTQLLLEDIATIRDGFDEQDKFSFYNGTPAVTLTVFRVGNETPISIEESVEEVIEELRQTMPEGLEFTIWDSRADAYRGRMGLLLRNGLLGLTLVFILLSLFLEMRLAFWVMLGIPISFMGTFIFMSGADVSLNMITMFAFLISLGIVVDDAIVVGENIYHYHQEGMPFLQAAIKGARQIALPVTFSIITNIVAFMPMYFVPGVMGKFFRVIPLVVCSTFLISLIESLFILPAHLGHQSDKKRTGKLHQFQLAFSAGFARFARDVYGPFLDRVLRARYITLFVGITILIVTLGYIKSGRMGFEMFPDVEADVALCAYSLPYGSPVESTRAVQDQIINAGKQAILKIEEEFGKPVAKGVKSNIGGRVWGRSNPTGGHAGRIQYELLPPSDRPISTEDFVQRWRAEARGIKGLKSIRFRSNSGGPGGNQDAFSIDLSHRNMNVLEQASQELATALQAYPMVRDIDDGFTPGKEQIDFSILPAGRSLGLTSRDVARQVRNSYYGAEAIRQQRGRNEIKIKVRLPKEERDTEYSLEELIIRTPAGIEVPLREVAETKRGRAYTSIVRREGRRVVSVSGDVEPRDQTPQILTAIQEDLLPPILQKYSGLSYSFEGREADRRESVNGLINGLLIALLLIYVLLAIPFNSYAQPLIIMVSIPFGIVGAVLGHLLLNYSLSLISLFGVVALSGVVVNDALVFIDFANQRRRAGLALHDAVRSAGIQRFRPIILTTLTTFFGLMPMIVETSRQARFLIPMAISLGFGILFATAITLLLIPSLMLILEDIGNLFKRKRL
jgi:multidrug efflux pump subunit AcrB